MTENVSKNRFRVQSHPTMAFPICHKTFEVSTQNLACFKIFESTMYYSIVTYSDDPEFKLICIFPCRTFNIVFVCIRREKKLVCLLRSKKILDSGVSMHI